MPAVRIVVSGLVQGVGYRAWFQRAAMDAGLSGWVRNRVDGTVEAVVAGEAAALEAVVASAGHGPAAARVSNVIVETPLEPMSELVGFRVLPTR